MALYKPVEFANICGLSRANISTYISRGKIIVTGKFIDDTIPQNRDFLEKQLLKNGEKITVKPENTETTNKSDPVIIEKNNSKKNAVGPDHSLYELEKKIKEADLNKKHVDTRIQRLKEEKLLGTLIPAELVKILIAQHFKSVATSFSNAAESLVVAISKKKQLNKIEEADIKGELITILNKAVRDAVDASKKNVRNIQQEYSELRGVGERR